MLKKLFIILGLISLASPLLADNELIKYRINFILENDAFHQTDEDYSSGESLSAIFYVPHPTSPFFTLFKSKEKKTDTFFNFAIVNQIYTPSNVKITEPIVDDHPYAGWTYIKVAILQSSNIDLKALSLKLGIVGEASGSKNIQYNFHKITGSDKVMGWDNQLHNEIGINLQYLYKQHHRISDIGGMQRAFTPFVEVQFGNIAINVSSGVIVRFGWNIPKDFGFSNINIGNEDGIPLYNERKYVTKSPWSFNFNVTASATAVARDIFLDGNTFRDSYSVEKENFIGHFGYGFSARYKKFVFEFLGVINTRQFKTQKTNHAVGSMKFAWIF